MEEMDQVAIDTAVILDEQVQERVTKVAHAYLQKVLPALIDKEFSDRFNKEKEKSYKFPK